MRVRAVPALVLMVGLSVGCGQDLLQKSETGKLQAEVLHTSADTKVVDLDLTCGQNAFDKRAAATPPKTLVEIDDLKPGLCNARVIARTGNAVALQSVWVSDVLIVAGKTTEITVDMGQPNASVPPGCQETCGQKVCGDDGCGGSCGSCASGKVCNSSGQCVESCAPACSGKDCGDDGCGGSCGSCASGESCTAQGTCQATTQPAVGCADGTREGFQSLTDYPRIAACSGGWTVGGVTRPNLVPTCNRQAGNNGVNQEGTGCSAADLCASGWHVCNGKTEVQADTGSKGCQDSVPAGTPDKAMFFAVQQHSDMNSVCDDTQTTRDNDVFGCGNLGVQLTSDKNCGVLTRALASEQPGKCGYNEAEPPLGPWQCPAVVAHSDLHEGGIVVKDGCPNTSCSWNGAPTANWDRGGVLCCED